jgi:hypothetical protein
MIVDRHVAIDDPRTAAELLRLLEYGGFPAARRDGITLNDRLRAALDDLATFSRERVGTLAERPPVTVRSVSAADYAEQIGTSKRAVTARCRRGTLPAELTPRGWRIYVDELDQEVSA